MSFFMETEKKLSEILPKEIACLTMDYVGNEHHSRFIEFVNEYSKAIEGRRPIDIWPRVCDREYSYPARDYAIKWRRLNDGAFPLNIADGIFFRHLTNMTNFKEGRLLLLVSSVPMKMLNYVNSEFGYRIACRRSCFCCYRANSGDSMSYMLRSDNMLI